MEHTLRLAFCSLAAAVSAVLMFLTGILPIGTLAIPALAGAMLLPVVIELGTGWAFSVYLSVTFLSFFIAPDREAALFYALFFGFYPILKAVLEHRFSKGLALLLKLSVFTAAAVLEFWVSVRILQLPQDSLEIFGKYSQIVLLVAGEFVFLLYDYAFSLLVSEYVDKFHSSVEKWLRTNVKR